MEEFHQLLPGLRTFLGKGPVPGCVLPTLRRAQALSYTLGFPKQSTQWVKASPSLHDLALPQHLTGGGWGRTLPVRRPGTDLKC